MMQDKGTTPAQMAAWEASADARAAMYGQPKQGPRAALPGQVRDPRQAQVTRPGMDRRLSALLFAAGGAGTAWLAVYALSDMAGSKSPTAFATGAAIPSGLIAGFIGLVRNESF
jgi:ferric-dicitrate binding protein FerR (iron transport regulator)